MSASSSSSVTAPPARPSILDRLEAFLPAMRASNADLERRVAADPLSVSVEHLDDPEEQHIEMDLACGLFDLKPKEGGGDGVDGVQPSSDGNSDSDSDSDASDGELQQLQLPSQQTAAVTAAKKAGRTLVAEVEEEVLGDGGEGVDDGDGTDTLREQRGKASERAKVRTAAAAASGGGIDGGSRRSSSHAAPSASASSSSRKLQQQQKKRLREDD